MKEKDQNENSLLNNIKNKYILQNLFKYLAYEKVLKIIKYNKNIQNRLNINKNTYKDYLKIELEIIPKEKVYGTFINNYSYYKSYCHIYFNNNKEEIKRSYILATDNVKNIKIIIDYEVKSFNELFSKCKCIEKIKFLEFKRNDITNMRAMFYQCSSLKELNLYNFNTNNVTDISLMFKECSSLEKLNISKWNTNNVKDMSQMFYNCSNLRFLPDISKWNTNNVKDMSWMFYNCSKLRTLPDISKWNTNNVNNIRYMFYECSSLRSLPDISKWNTNNVKDMSQMFYKCSSLLTLSGIKMEY